MHRPRSSTLRAVALCTIALVAGGPSGLAAAGGAPTRAVTGGTPRQVTAARELTAPASVTLDGHGYGHGVGLSQWGAYGYAVDDGWSAEQILDHYFGGTVADAIDGRTPVTVRLQDLDGAQTAVVSDTGRIVATDGAGQMAGGPWRSLVARYAGSDRYEVWARSDAVVCPGAGERLAPETGWILLSNAAGPAVTVRSEGAADDAAFADLLAVCQPDGQVRSYRGTLRAVNAPAGTSVPRTAADSRTVNELGIDQLARSVIAKEMSPSWASAGGGRGMQALRAQAVAVRSYALAYRWYSFAQVCDRTCVAYYGAAVRRNLAAGYVAVEHSLSDPAVTSTTGSVRRVGSAAGPFALTMYAASSGGYTAPAQGFPAVPDGGDDTFANPNHSWSVVIPAATITAKYPAIGTFASITVAQRNGFGDLGGRVLRVTIAGSAGSVTVTGDQLRSALGLRSNWFAVRGQVPERETEAIPQGGTASAPARRLV